MKKVKIKILEVWKPIIVIQKDKKISTHYSISNKGRVINNYTNKIIKPQSDGNYLQVALFIKPKTRVMCKVHRLVAGAFIPNIENKKCVNHKNGRKHDNYKMNLEWNTYSENNKHAYDNNLHKKGELNTHSKYKETFIINICELLESGYRPKKIKLLLGYDVGDLKISKLISKIKSRKTWTHISKNYNW